VNDDQEACEYAFDELRYRLESQSDTVLKIRALRKIEEAEAAVEKVLMHEMQRRGRYDNEES
jgi:hypothetical protein